MYATALHAASPSRSLARLRSGVPDRWLMIHLLKRQKRSVQHPMLPHAKVGLESVVVPSQLGSK